MITLKKVDLADKFTRIDTYWDPKCVGTLNNQVVKLAKLKGEFIWHHHAVEDEMFLVVQGTLVIQIRDEDDTIQAITLKPGEFLIVPRGVEHKPVALDKEVHVILFEPATTVNTGNVHNERTVDNPTTI